MVLRQVRIGSLENIHQFDDADFDKAIETDIPISVGAPVDVGDALRKGDEGDGGSLDGDKLDIDWNPSNYTPDATIAEADDVDDLSAHLKGIDDELGSKVNDENWADYFGSCNPVGWAVAPTGFLHYLKVGKVVHVRFLITGTSNANSVSFDLPYTSKNDNDNNNIIKIQDNTTTVSFGLLVVTANSVTATCYPAASTTLTWTASNTKSVRGTFSYAV